MRRWGRLRTSQATSGRSSGYFVLVVKVTRESRCDNRPGAAVLVWWKGGGAVKKPSGSPRQSFP